MAYIPTFQKVLRTRLTYPTCTSLAVFACRAGFRSLSPQQSPEICALYRKSSCVFCFTCFAVLLQADSRRMHFY
jgi:hypothetical protein